MAPEEPYVGPRAFAKQDRGRFFARDREANELLSLITAHRAVLLYARTGAGKSSLLNAKLVPMLEENGFHVLPTARVRPVGSETEADLSGWTNIYTFNILTSLEKEIPREQLLHRSLDSYLLYPVTKKEIPRVLIIDQFEELFTTGFWQDRGPFFEQLRRSLKGDPMLRLVLSMREDYIARLDPYTDLLPERLEEHFRLELLREGAAVAAVTRPLEAIGRRFAPGVAEELVSNLLSVKTPVARRTMKGEFIEPVQLQMVCQSLWRSVHGTANSEITRDQLVRFGNVDEVLCRFYETAIARVSAVTEVREGFLRRWFENTLITPRGIRTPVWRGEAATAGLPNRAVDELEKDRLIFAEIRGEITWYELAHERFIDAVHDSNAAWRSKQAKEDEVRRHLETKASDWRHQGCSFNRLLHEDELQRAEAWIDSPDAEDLGVSEAVVTFVTASRAFLAGQASGPSLTGIFRRVESGKYPFLLLVILLSAFFSLFFLVTPQETKVTPRISSTDQVLARQEIIHATDLLERSRRNNDRPGELGALEKIGAANERLGEPQEALLAYEKALHISRDLFKPHVETRLLRQTGILLSRLGKLPMALERLQEALYLSQNQGNLIEECNIWLSIGEIRRRLGNLAEGSLAFERAMALATRIDNPEASIRAARLGGLTRVDQGDVEEGFYLLRQAHDGAMATGNRNEALEALLTSAEAYLRIGDARTALDHLNGARYLLGEKASKSSIHWLWLKGRAHEIRGDTFTARNSYSQVLDLAVHSTDLPALEVRALSGLIRTRRSDADESAALSLLLRMGHLPGVANDPEAHAEFLLAQADLASRESIHSLAAQSLDEVLTIAQRSGNPWNEMEALSRKARLPGVSPREALALLRKAVTVGETLQGRVHRRDLLLAVSSQLKNAYELLVDDLLQLYEVTSDERYLAEAFEASEAGRAAALLRELEAPAVRPSDVTLAALLEKQRELLLRLSAPELPDLRSIGSSDTLASSVKRAERALLTGEYWQNHAEITQADGGEHRRSRLSIRDVQQRILDNSTVLLEYSLGEKRSWLFVVSRKEAKVFRLPPRAEIERAVTVAGFLVRRRPRARDFRTAHLSNMLLAPAAASLMERIAVVPDGALNFVPFAALADPTAASGNYLINRCEIVHIPSATVLGRLRRRADKVRLSSRDLAVLSDPVVTTGDPRLSAHIGDLPSIPDSASNSQARLFGTQREADTIAQMLPGSGTLKASGFSANRALFLNNTLSRYSILHLALPVRVDTANGDETTLVLSSFDSQGRRQNGSLRAYEVLGLRLASNLVVLSSGETALGELVRGEGLVGLPQAFLSAGAGKVVDTLWLVEDQAAADLMIRFYRQLLLKDKPPAAALRAAQLETLNTKRGRLSSDWAAFRLEGDWR